MIHIQIANAVTETGVGDIRWVLLDPSEVPLATAEAASPAAAGAAAAVRSDTPAAQRSGREADWTYQVLRVLVLASALAGALWLASSTLERRGPGAKAALVAAPTQR